MDITKKNNTSKLEYSSILNLRGLFINEDSNLLLSCLEQNLLPLNDEVATKFLSNIILHIQFDNVFYTKAFSILNQYNIDKEDIVNNTISSSNYQSLLFLEKQNFLNFTLSQKLLTLINYHPSSTNNHLLFKKIIIENKINPLLQKELFTYATELSAISFLNIMIKEFGIPTGQLLEELLKTVTFNDQVDVFPLFYIHSSDNFKTYAKQSFQHSSIDILIYLYFNFSHSDEEVIYFYNLFFDSKFNKTYDSVLFQRITIDYNISIMKTKITDF